LPGGAVIRPSRDGGLFGAGRVADAAGDGAV
jgi:hypothetical protein